MWKNFPKEAKSPAYGWRRSHVGPETGGNKSALHWDLICDLRGGGRLSADGAPILEAGPVPFDWHLSHRPSFGYGRRLPLHELDAWLHVENRRAAPLMR